MSLDFSLWCDFIKRDFLEDEFITLIDSGLISGATSNPSIFANALKSDIYADEIRSLRGKKAKAIYEHLAIADILRAAQILKPMWENDKTKGFISIEIDPFLCDSVGESIAEGERLYKAINMPNVMIKVPSTDSGYEVMSALANKGINVNATLIFTPTQARLCAIALKDGVKANANFQGVISVFVSRFDRAVDTHLAPHLKAQCGIINAMECYEVIENLGLGHIRTLFASTGVKDDSLPKSYYIDKLLLPHSVNTAPLDAIKGFMMSEYVAQSALIDTDTRARFWLDLRESSIERESLSQTLLNEGLIAFKDSFEALLRGLG